MAKIIRDKMDQHTTRRALEMVGEDAEWQDSEVGGLSIRIRKTSANWILRARLSGKLSTWTVGPVQSVGLKEARERTQQAKLMLRANNNPKTWLLEQVSGVKVLDKKPEADGLTFDECKSRFLAFIEQNRRLKTYTDYRNTLNSPYLKVIRNKPIREITKFDIRRIQENVFNEGKTTMSEHILTICKSFFSWTCEQSWTDLDVNVCSTLKKIEGKRTQPRDNLPSREQLGKALLHIENCDLTIRAVISLLLFTSQRIETILTAKKEDFINDENGNIIWNIRGDSMKGHKNHPLPISPVLWNIIKNQLTIKPKNLYLFPVMKTRSLANPDLTGHISYRAIANNMRDFGFNPHDVRRAFATYLLENGTGLADIKIILDHSEGTNNDITLRHYTVSTFMNLKGKILNEWQTLLLNWAYSQSENNELPLYLQG